jgi:signal transduction histidine kinase
MMRTMASARARIGKRDVVITVVLSALGVYLMYENVWGNPVAERPSDQRAAVHIGNLAPYELAVPLFLLVTVPLLWRRVAPLAAVGAAFGGLVVNEVLLGSEVLRCGVLLPTAFLFAFAVGAQLGGRDSRLGLGLALAMVLLSVSLEFGAVTAAVTAGVTVAVWVIGRVVRSRGHMADELRLRTEELREARDDRARLEVASYRAQLSGELDELLQRRLGGLAQMAGAHTPSSDPDAATATLVDIERESRRTLEEMRAVVGVLRNDEAESPTAPQPTLTHLDAMLVRAKGDNAHLTVEGSPRVLPAAVELSAYRIVEHLLAAMEDAPGVGVRIRFGDDALELAVSGPARRRAKESIERARERARLQRGTLDATVRSGRAEAVVSLPVLATR